MLNETLSLSPLTVDFVAFVQQSALSVIKPPDNKAQTGCALRGFTYFKL
jgi:hypothetical protein